MWPGVRERGRARGPCQSADGGSDPAPGLGTQQEDASPARGAPPRRLVCGCERVPVCVRVGLRALPPRGALQSSSPTRSLPSRLCIAAGGGGGQRGVGKPGGEGHGREARVAVGEASRRHLPCGSFALAPGGSRADGAGRRPCAASLVRLGRRPQQRSPRAAYGRRAAAPAEPPPRAGAGGAGGVGVRTRAAATAAARGSRSRPAAGGRGPRGPRTQRRPATPRRLITFASAPGGSLLQVAPSRSRHPEGEFLPVDVLFRNAKDQ